VFTQISIRTKEDLLKVQRDLYSLTSFVLVQCPFPKSCVRVGVVTICHM